MEKSNKNQELTVAIVLYKEDFDLIFKTLDKLRYFKIIIIDNANNINLKNKIIRNFTIEKYVLNKKNLGFSAGYNQAAKICKSKYFLILAPDCIISHSSINNLHDYLSKDPNCFLVAPTAYNQDMTSMTYVGGPLPENANRNIILNLSGNTCVEGVLGSCMLLRTSDFINIGMFDEKFFIYFSDDDLCRRISLLKKSIIQIYNSKCIHTHGIIKLKNKYIGKFVRENNYTFDHLYYYFKINKNHYEIKKIFNKIPSLIIKLFVKFITLNILKFVEISARLYAILKFLIKLKLY